MTYTMEMRSGSSPGFWFRCSCGRSGTLQKTEDAAMDKWEEHVKLHSVEHTFVVKVDGTQAGPVRHALRSWRFEEVVA